MPAPIGGVCFSWPSSARRGSARSGLRSGGGQAKACPTSDEALTQQLSAARIVALDDALNALAQFRPRNAKVVEMRFFGGLSVEETAEVLKISGQSVMRDWKLARAWLMREMGTY